MDLDKMIKESGGTLALARTLESEMYQYYVCKKPGCAYCHAMRQYATVPLPETMYVMDNVKDDYNAVKRFTAKEEELILTKIPIKRMAEILGRSKYAIATKRYRMQFKVAGFRK